MDRFAHIRLAVSNFIPGITDETASLGLQNLDLEREQWAQDQCKTLYISSTNPIFIKQLASFAEQNFAFSTACWPDGSLSKLPIRLLFLGEQFFNLPESEQLFVLAHELSHLETNHLKRRVLFVKWQPLVVQVFGFLAAFFVVLDRHYISFLNSSSLLTVVIIASLVSIGLQTILNHIGTFLQTYQCRRQEFEADQLAINKLRSTEGARAFINRLIQREQSVSWWQQLFSLHPRSHDRLQKINKRASILHQDI